MIAAPSSFILTWEWHYQYQSIRPTDSGEVTLLSCFVSLNGASFYAALSHQVFLETVCLISNAS